jgi:hypothetical protein
MFLDPEVGGPFALLDGAQAGPGAKARDCITHFGGGVVALD